MVWSEMWTWNADTPASVPAGARISAGKSGKVARSLPEQGRRGGEPVAGELHAVAGVAGESDDHAVEQVGRFVVSVVSDTVLLFSAYCRLPDARSPVRTYSAPSALPSDARADGHP